MEKNIDTTITNKLSKEKIFYSKKILIKNFRNIGFEEETELLLPASFDFNKQGGLILIIGENNSGKSNILDALMAFDSKYKFDKLDVHNQHMFDMSKILLEVKTSSFGKKHSITRPLLATKYDVDIPKEHYEYKEILNLISKFRDLISERSSYYYSERITNDTLSKFIKKFIKEFDDFENNKENIKIDKLWLKDKIITNIYILDKYVIDENDNDWKIFNRKCEEFFKIKKNLNTNWNDDKNFSINVVKYEESKEIDKLSILHNEIPKSSFFVSLFGILNYDYNKINSLFKQSDILDTTGNIDYELEMLNEKLELIANDFNKLYSFDKQQYSFKIQLDKEKITFNIFKNKIPVSLKQQSVGFKGRTL